MNEQEKKPLWHPAVWVTSNYVAMGIPFSMVIWVAATIFKDLGHTDGEITVATASIGIVWSLKPLWAGFLDMFKTKKFFVLSMEFVIGLLFVLMGLALQLSSYFSAIIGLMWIVAFASATQDICSDGIYISALDKQNQAKYIGVQGMAWNLGRVVAVAAVVGFAGYLQDSSGMSPKNSWMIALFASGGLMTAFGLFHTIALPTGSPPEDRGDVSAGQVVREFMASAADFCNKRALWGMLAFVFFYRSGEGLLLIEAPLYMQGCLEDGALQLSLQEKGLIDGVVSTIAGILGGLAGGAFISRYSLKRTLFVLALCVNVPNGCYVYLSHVVSVDDPRTFWEIATVVSVEKFWYGFGFVGNMLFMMQQIAPGKFKMTHYAFATAFMNLVLVPTQMASGPLADMMGFKEFFYLVMFAMTPSLLAAWFVPFPQLQAPDEDTSVDDDSLLDEDDRTVQKAAQKSTVLAILAVVVFLYPDVLCIGWMSQTQSGMALAVFLGWFAFSAALKLVLCVLAVRSAKAALAAARPLSGGRAYVSNAIGSLVAAIVMLAVTGVLGYFNHRTYTTTDWECAFGESSGICLQGLNGDDKLKVAINAALCPNQGFSEEELESMEATLTRAELVRKLEQLSYQGCDHPPLSTTLGELKGDEEGKRIEVEFAQPMDPGVARAALSGGTSGFNFQSVNARGKTISAHYRPKQNCEHDYIPRAGGIAPTVKKEQ